VFQLSKDCIGTAMSHGTPTFNTSINMVNLYVRGTVLHQIDTATAATVADVLSLVAVNEEIAVQDLQLVREGVFLSNDTTLAQFEEGCSFDIHCGLPGGKVHGSLSRAGKVKGQTPKVDKQDKKKSKTGRAKRRFQYNRRFVNVVQGFGKKRGPNSNQS